MDILAEVRELTHAAHRTAVDRLPRTLRHIAGYQESDRGGAGGADSLAGLTHQILVAERKTGALFGAACELGAVAAHSPDAAWCRAFGRNLGTAYQIADDLTDGWPGPRSSRDRGRGEARRRIAAALHHLDTAAEAGSAAAEDLRLLACAVLAEPGWTAADPHPGSAHTAGITSEEIGS